MKSAYETIATFENAVQAHLAKAKLESEGLEAHLRDEHTIGMNPLYSPILGGVKLQVETQDAALARRILARDDSEVAHEEGGGASEVAVCPRCGSSEIELRGEVFGRLMLVISWLLSGVLLRPRSQWWCKGCGHSWKRW